MPDVETSAIVERDEHRVLLEQEAVARMLMFSRRIHLLLDIEEEPAALRFRDRCGISFSTYSGMWRLEEHGTAVAVKYELEAKPSFAVPGFVLKRLLTRDARMMIDRLRQEIVARVAETTRATAHWSRGTLSPAYAVRPTHR
jgi:hypothetical protein